MRTWLFSVLVFLCSGSAHGFVLASGPVEALTTETALCHVVNIGTGNASVVVTLADADNGSLNPPLADTCASIFGGVLPPGSGCVVVDQTPRARMAWCRVMSNVTTLRGTMWAQAIDGGMRVGMELR